MEFTMNFETGEGSGGMILKNTTMEAVAKYFDGQHVRFVKGVSMVHRKSVFQILIRLMKLCPVDTGRLRGSWTPYMDDHGFGGYVAFIDSPSEAPATRKTPKQGFSLSEYQKGKTQGDWLEQALDTTIGSNVAYAPYVEEKTNFLSKLLVWADMQYNNNMERFFDAAARQGWIPEVDPNQTEGA